MYILLWSTTKNTIRKHISSTENGFKPFAPRAWNRRENDLSNLKIIIKPLPPPCCGHIIVNSQEFPEITLGAKGLRIIAVHSWQHCVIKVWISPNISGKVSTTCQKLTNTSSSTPNAQKAHVHYKFQPSMKWCKPYISAREKTFRSSLYWISWTMSWFYLMVWKARVVGLIKSWYRSPTIHTRNIFFQNNLKSDHSYKVLLVV